MALAPDQDGQWPGWTEKMCKPPSTYQHLGSEGDWLNFFWGLWTGPYDVQYSRDDINKLYDKSSHRKKDMDVHCIPRTDPSGEAGWTCRDYKFVESKSRFGLFGRFWLPWLVKKVVYSNEYVRGNSWDQIWDTAKDSFGFDKTEHFMDISRRAKVIY